LGFGVFGGDDRIGGYFAVGVEVVGERLIAEQAES
jgi:hypothetical protein